MAEFSKTVDEALTIMEAVARMGPVTVAQLVRHLKMSRTVVTRNAETLRRRGYLRRTEDGYVLGSQLIFLKPQAEATLIGIAEGVLQDLAAEMNETFILTLRDGTEAVQVAQAVNTDLMVRIELKTGFRHPLSRGASGLAILAFLDDSEIDKALRGAAGADEVRARLPDIREQGYASSSSELTDGFQGVSVPLWVENHVIGSLGVIVGMAQTEKMLAAVPKLQMAAQEVSGTFTQT